jgi:hypothetical protein
MIHPPGTVGANLHMIRDGDLATLLHWFVFRTLPPQAMEGLERGMSALANTSGRWAEGE